MSEPDIVKSCFFGSVNVKIENLISQKEYFKTNAIKEKLRESILKEGLLNPFELTWDLMQPDKLFVRKGGGRLIILKELGWKEVPACIRVLVTKESETIVDGLKNILPFISEIIGIGLAYPIDYKRWEFEGQT